MNTKNSFMTDEIPIINSVNRSKSSDSGSFISSDSIKKVRKMHKSSKTNTKGFENNSTEYRMNAQQRAHAYLSERKIFELFNFLIGHLLVDEPIDPIEYLFDLLDKCILFRSGLAEPPLIFTPRHIESMFQSLDPSGVGNITLNQYRVGMTTLGVGCHSPNPPQCKEGFVDKLTFEKEAISVCVECDRFAEN
ncbi:uncharacterized protein LOC117171831 isoform X2 [Belonocnema kinseyi]|uniref:uncharacterized protein LOC117171831 isoform X2 n=1 Tax=Belonocnema kinseyi TaxID=2817044 RepID=UPI00143CEC64|nr:uncharacterized protein LOC117171831 isoform X2 [Belonocnema kinseyi]